MIRAANTGVSAVIDAYGRVLASLDMEQQGIIDHPIPPARAATLYGRWGDWTLLALIVFLGQRCSLVVAKGRQCGCVILTFNALRVELALSGRGGKVSYAVLTCRYAFLHLMDLRPSAT